ncbi:MAG: DMT family transporter [Tannerellaceae bacterium]
MITNDKKQLVTANLAVFFAEMFNGLNINAQKYLLPEWSSSYTMFFLRCAFAVVAFWIVSLFIKKEETTPRDRLHMILIGAIVLSGYIFFYLIGVEYSSPIDSSLIFTTMPVLVLILSFFVFKEHISGNKLVGIFMGIGGAVWIVMKQNTVSVHTQSMLGNVFCFVSALCYAVYLIRNKRYTQKYSSITMLKWIFLGAFLVSSVVLAIKGFESKIFTETQNLLPLAVLIFVLIFPTFLTYLLLAYGLKKLSTTAVAMYDYEVPIIASTIALFLGQAKFEWYQLLASMLIFTGVYIVSRETNKK